MDRIAILLVCLLASTPTRASGPGASPVKGQRVFVAGHSFHVPIATPLAQIAQSAGIADHELTGQQGIGGSTVAQHWDLPDDRNKVKAAVRAGRVDVLTLSPFVVLPDPAIDKFADLLLAHNPAGRVTVQASWVPRDGVVGRGFTNAKRDQTDPTTLRRAAAEYMDKARAQIRAVNERHAGAAGKPVALLVPAGEAVVRLRERVAKGGVPGIARQADLFRDELGHGREPIHVLNAYCHYAVIYGRSPVGLPVPAALDRAGLGQNVGKVNRVLQEVAWEAVLAEPASGVKEPARP